MLAVITTVFEDRDNILKTLHSIANNSVVECMIIVDANSKDGTKEAILEFIGVSDEVFNKDFTVHSPLIVQFKKKRVVFISQSDSGIYHGMNRGLLLLKDHGCAQFCMFINSGDILESPPARLSADITFGALKIVYGNGTSRISKPSGDTNKLYQLFAGFGHPNAIFKVSTIAKFEYDLRYKLASDYDLFYRMYNDGAKIDFRNEVCATFATGGTSDINWKKSLQEALEIALKHTKGKRFRIYSFYAFSIIKKLIKKLIF